MSIPAVLGLDIPNVLPDSIFGVEIDWLQPAGRLIWSSLITVVAGGIIFFFARRPKGPEPSTWAASMAGAVGSFALMLLAFGVVPHEWITFANSYLNWGKDSYLIQQNSVVPFNITMAVVTDTIEVLIYGVLVSGAVALIVLWQKRPVAEPADSESEPERTETGTSAYGRPVTTAG